MTEFVMRSITDKPITVIQNMGELLTELKRQGNNLNQAVRNYYNDNDTRAELSDCVAKLKELYKSLIAAIEGKSNATT